MSQASILEKALEKEAALISPAFAKAALAASRASLLKAKTSETEAIVAKNAAAKASVDAAAKAEVAAAAAAAAAWEEEEEEEEARPCHKLQYSKRRSKMKPR